MCSYCLKRCDEHSSSSSRSSRAPLSLRGTLLWGFEEFTTRYKVIKVNPNSVCFWCAGDYNSGVLLSVSLEPAKHLSNNSSLTWWKPPPPPLWASCPSLSRPLKIFQPCSSAQILQARRLKRRIIEWRKKELLQFLPIVCSELQDFSDLMKVCRLQVLDSLLPWEREVINSPMRHVGNHRVSEDAELPPPERLHVGWLKESLMN